MAIRRQWRAASSSRNSPLAACLVAATVVLGSCGAEPESRDGRPTAARDAAGRLHVEVEGDVVTIHAREAPLREVLRVLSRKSDLVIFAHDPLDSPVTLDVEREPLDAALRRLLDGRSFALHESRDASGARSWRLTIFPRSGRRPLTADRADAQRASGESRTDAAALAIAAVAHPDPATRADAVFDLADTEPFAALPYLRHALRDPDADVREAAIDTLAGIGSDEAVGLLRRAAAEDRDAGVRALAADVLVEIDQGS